MFKFKKIASILASTLMIGSTIGLAAAANYPAPFVTGGSADAAIVYGTTAANTDLVAVVDITNNLNGFVTSNTVTTESTVSGEAYPLFTSGTPLLLNSTLNSVRSTVSSSHLPTALADGIFQTTSNIDYTQRIELGSTPKLEFKQQPSSSDDPQLGFSLSTTPSTGYIYNATVIFDENVNFTHADSIGETLELFGKTYTVSGASTTTKLILLESSEEVTLSNENPSAEVTVEGNTYTLELISASDTDANIRVTDSSGNSNSKVVAESNSKTIQGLEVAVDAADENNFQITATLLVGSSRITFQDGSAVKTGSDETTIEGTLTQFELTNGTESTNPTLIGKLIIQTTTDSSDKDAFFPGGEFIDPVFGSIKLDFSGITIPLDSTAREDIEIKNSGNDKMTVKLESHDGSESMSVNWAYNKTGSEAPTATGINPGVTGIDLADSDGDKIVVREMGAVNRSEFVVLSSDDEGGLYEVTAIYNASTGFADDYVRLKYVFTGNEKEYKATSEGTITGVTEQGKTYTITYTGASTVAEETRQVRINYDESSGQNMILFPTIATSKGAKVAFYEPTRVQIDAWDGSANGSTNATGFLFQDGDGYGTVTITGGITNVGGAGGNYSFTFPGGSAQNLQANNSVGSVTGAIGKLTYNISVAGAATGSQSWNTFDVYLQNPQGGGVLRRPALIVFEEKDDASNYEAMVVTLDGGYDGDSAGLGVSDVVRTWSSDGTNDEAQLETNSDLYQDMDLWGSLMTLDKSDSDQTTATISYPDEQVIANVYIAEVGASITAGSSSSGGGAANIVAIADSEISSVAGKSIIVVGGSCVNSVAADLLGVATGTCGAAFTDATTVGANSYLIQSFDRTGGAMATLVAGFNAGDTTNAARYLTTQTVDTTAGMKYVGTSATSAELVTATTTTTDTTA